MRRSSGDTGSEPREDLLAESEEEFAELDRLLLLSWSMMLWFVRSVLVVGRLES